MSSREPEIHSLNLNTRFADNAGQPDYLRQPVWYLSESLENVSSVKLKNFTIPLSVYNIDSRNNKLALVQANNTASTLLVTLPSRNYTGTSLASQLQTSLKSAGTPYVYNIAYQTDGSNVLTIGTTSGNFSFNTTDNDAYYELGLDYSLNTMGSTITTGSIDLSGVNSIHLVSNVGGTEVVGKNYKILATVTTEENALDISYFQDDSNDDVNCAVPSLNEIRLSLFDNRFRVISPQKDYSLTVNFQTE